MRGRNAQRTAAARILDAALLSIALGVGIASVIALAGRAHWIAELFTHFRVQYVVVQIAVLIGLTLRWRMLASALTVPLLVANLLGLADYWPSREARADTDDDFRLLTANLDRHNDDSARFVALVRELEPDAIVLLEVTPAWSDALVTLARDYPAQHLVPREDAFGIGLMSRAPLAAVETVDLGGAPAVDAALWLRDGRRLRLVGAHLWTPVSRARAGARNAQLEALGDLTGGLSEPLVVTGDFNITPYSPVLSAWLAATGLVDPRRGRGFAMTWPVGFPVLGIPIDHSFVNEHVMASEPRRSAAFGSDHFAIMTSLSLRE